MKGPLEQADPRVATVMYLAFLFLLISAALMFTDHLKAGQVVGVGTLGLSCGGLILDRYLSRRPR